MNTANINKEEKILEKVKKLLALAGNNPSQEEAQAAAAKAQALLAEYNLTLEETGNEDETIDFTYFDTGVDRSWKYDLASVVARNFRCKCLWWGRARVGFYGYKHDTEVASQVFEFLFWAIRRNLRKVKKQVKEEKGTAKGVIFSYSQGFIKGVQEVLDAQCTALMVVTPKEVNEAYEGYCKSSNVKSININRRDAKDFSKETYNKGLKDGKDTMKRREIGG